MRRRIDRLDPERYSTVNERRIEDPRWPVSGRLPTKGETSGALRREEASLGDSEVGGADRDRTDDLRLAKPALSQLSYSPPFQDSWWAWEDLNFRPHAYQACALTN